MDVGDCPLPTAARLKALHGDGPTLTVVIPSRGTPPEVLLKTVESLANQTVAPNEVIVVDDNPAPTISVAALPALPRSAPVQVLFSGGAGVSAARNVGWRHASSELVAFLDDDDEVEPEWTESLVRLTSAPGVALAFVGVTGADANAHAKGVVNTIEPASGGTLFDDLPVLFFAGAFAARVELLELVDGYDERLSFSENTDLGIRLVAELRRAGWSSATTSRPLVVVHRAPADQRRQSADDSLASIERVIDKHRALLSRDQRALAQYESVAGHHATRLGRNDRARHHFALAVRARPTQVRSWLRLLRSSVPIVEPRWWSQIQRSRSVNYAAPQGSRARGNRRDRESSLR